MFARLQDKSIHYTKTGAGTALLLVHGWGGTGHSLHKIACQLKDRYTVYTIDLPGFGSSDQPGKEWGIEQYAEIVLSFIHAYIGGPVYYFGHSFGGALGIYIAATKPEIISKLILAAPSFHRLPQKPNSLTAIANRMPLPHIGKLMFRKILYKLFFPRSDILNYPHLEHNYRTIVAKDLTPALPAVKVPTLILWGDKDRDTPVADAFLLEEGIEGAKLVIFPGVSHNFPLRQPDLVARYTIEFLC